MRRTLQNIVLLARRFGHEQRAVAAVEFALILPLLLLLYFGSIEAAALFTVDKRVNSVAATVGDLVSQWDPGDGDLGTGTGSVLADYLAAATAIMSPYSDGGLRIVVSLVQVRADGSTKILWSRANAAGTARSAGGSYAELVTASRMNEVSRGGCIIAAEASYAYLPLMAQVYNTALTLQHTNYFLPRFGSDRPIDLDTTALAANACTAT
jgi:Flp pilus assembly protein TadG